MEFDLNIADIQNHRLLIEQNDTTSPFLFLLLGNDFLKNLIEDTLRNFSFNACPVQHISLLLFKQSLVIL